MQNLMVDVDINIAQERQNKLQLNILCTYDIL